MRVFHQKSAFRHLAVAARQFGILALATWGLIHFDNPLIWVPLAFVQGLTVFNFTILLHEVVHHTIFERRRPVAERILGLLYAIPSGISASQFTRWLFGLSWARPFRATRCAYFTGSRPFATLPSRRASLPCWRWQRGDLSISTIR